MNDYLPGRPSKRLVREVRSFLWHYGIRPTGDRWLAAWDWAYTIARSYIVTELGRSRPRWPSPSEIAGQYLFLLLCDIQALGILRLPYRAGNQMPDSVVALIAAAGTRRLLTLEDKP